MNTNYDVIIAIITFKKIHFENKKTTVNWCTMERVLE